VKAAAPNDTGVAAHQKHGPFGWVLSLCLSVCPEPVLKTFSIFSITGGPNKTVSNLSIASKGVFASPKHTMPAAWLIAAREDAAFRTLSSLHPYRVTSK
jgi:hypothetical protein